jgi:hypothetical protein
VVVVIDKGYIDYELFWKWTGAVVSFVTGRRKCSVWVLEVRHLPLHRNILSDQTIELEGFLFPYIQGPVQIEIFSRYQAAPEDQNLCGNLSNALLIQIWTVLIAVSILKYLKYRSLFPWSLSNLVAMLRYNLFTYRNLWTWIDQPFEPPPVTMIQEQLILNWTAS